MNKIKHLFVLLLVSVLVSAFMPLEAVAQSTIVGAKYNQYKNLIEYFVFTSGKSTNAIFAQVGLGALAAAFIYLPFAVYEDHDFGF